MTARGAPRAAASSSCLRMADRKSTRLNSSHSQISYAVFCLKKKKIAQHSHDPDQRPLLPPLSHLTHPLSPPLVLPPLHLARAVHRLRLHAPPRTAPAHTPSA